MRDVDEIRKHSLLNLAIFHDKHSSPISKYTLGSNFKQTGKIILR